MRKRQIDDFDTTVIQATVRGLRDRHPSRVKKLLDLVYYFVFFLTALTVAARSSVPYEKGFALLNELQRRVGVDRFHAFAKEYVKEFR